MVRLINLQFMIILTSADTGIVRFVFAAWQVKVFPKSFLLKPLYTILFKMTPDLVTSSAESNNEPDCHHVTLGSGSPKIIFENN